MKIALVLERMDPARGGRETYTGQIAAQLAARGHDVTVLCQQVGGGWCAEGVEVVELGRRGLLRTGRARNFLADVRRESAGGKYDIVHAMLALPGADIYHPHGGTVPGSRDANRRRRGALGRRLHALFEPLNRGRALRARLEAEIMADPNVTCLAVSEWIAEHFDHYYGRTRNVRVVFNGVEVPDCDDAQRADWRQEIRYRLGVGPDDPVFVVVATNFPLKGVLETIAAFAKWYHKRPPGAGNGRLVVIGRELVEGYQRIASLRDVGRQVVFVPPTREIFPWYSAADAMILLTWYDPCSLVALEATRWGLPTLTTRFNGAAAVLESGAGHLVDSPRDTDAVVDALDELASPACRAGAVAACRELRDYLGMDRHVDELLAVYEEVTQRK